jgi:hypothetical protein
MLTLIPEWATDAPSIGFLTRAKARRSARVRMMLRSQPSTCLGEQALGWCCAGSQDLAEDISLMIKTGGATGPAVAMY